MLFQYRASLADRYTTIELTLSFNYKHMYPFKWYTLLSDTLDN